MLIVKYDPILQSTGTKLSSHLGSFNEFYFSVSENLELALCTLTCREGTLLSTGFPMEAAVKEASSQGRRRDLMVSTPSLCPPGTVHTSSQQGKFSLTHSGRGHTHTKRKEGRTIWKPWPFSPSWAAVVSIPKSCPWTLATCSMSSRQRFRF